MMKKANRSKKYISLVSAILLAANSVAMVSAEPERNVFDETENEIFNEETAENFISASDVALESEPPSEKLEGTIFYIKQYRDHVIISGHDKDTEITEADIPAEINGLPVTSIGNSAFEKCTALKSVKIPDSVESIGKDAFSGCTELEISSLPESVKVIHSDAFYKCEKIKEFTFHEGITEIGGHAFSGTGLTKITIPSTVTSSHDSVEVSPFTECAGLTEVVFAEGLKTIPDYFLKNAVTVTKVTIPETVTEIGYASFENIPVSEIKFPSELKKIGSCAFDKCASLKEIVLPEGIEVIGTATFRGCSLINEITLPEGITEMGMNAFSGTQLTKVTVPSTLSTIDVGTISYASPFSEISTLTEVVFADGMTKIPAYMLYKAEKVKKVTIPETVTEIGYGAFNDISVSEVKLPAGLKRIGMSAFSECTLIKEIDFPEGLEEIGMNAFSGTKLTKVTIPSTLSSIDTSTISCASPFNGCETLTDVVFADGMTVIPSYMLYKAYNVKNVTIPDTVKEIEFDAFGDTSISEIKLPAGLKRIGSYAFEKCTLLKEINLPEGLEEMGRDIFTETKITKVTIPSTLKTISNGAISMDSPFTGCTTLTDVAFTSGMTKIPSYMLYNVPSVTTLTIPSTVTEFGGYAFCGCSSLNTIYGIPNFDGIKIGTDALKGVDVANIKFIADIPSTAPTTAPVTTTPAPATATPAPTTTPATTAPVPSAPPSEKKGDVDGDGNLTTTDVKNILKYIVGKVTFTDEQKANADINSDKEVNSADALLLLRKVVGKTETK